MRTVSAALTARRLALAGLLCVGLAYATVVQSFSWNQTSHYALIRQLDNDTAVIDPYINTTGDKAFYHGHWYSARAPGLAFFSLPFYRGLVDAGVPSWADHHVAPSQRPGDSVIWALGLWGGVLPGLVLLLLLWRLAERFEPGYGALAALTIGLGTLIMPLSTLLFSHVFTACLAFAAFGLLVHERDGPPRLWQVGVAGALIGYGITSEYPIYFAGVVLGLYALSRRDRRRPLELAARAGTYAGGAIAGIVPLLLYNRLAFGSLTHIAYADIPRQKAGFFGIGTPRLSTLVTLLLDSRGLLTLAPVLALALAGLVLLHRRGRRAEAYAITGIVVLYLAYNSGYYLPFGGGSPGPRFLTTVLPFLGIPLALAFRRFPGPAIALAAVSATTMILATITHPLVGYETETVVWARYLGQGYFQPTIASLYGAGRGWGAISPFLVLVALGALLVLAATPRMRFDGRALLAAAGALAVWAVWAAFGPAALRIDHNALAQIVKAGDPTALHKPWPSHPLTHLVVIAVVAAIVCVLAAALARGVTARRVAT